MRYIIADIHGCYERYKALLDKINFSKQDELYILGDVVDRGPEPIKVLQDMMKRANVKLIIGNWRASAWRRGSVFMFRCKKILNRRQGVRV